MTRRRFFAAVCAGAAAFACLYLGFESRKLAADPSNSAFVVENDPSNAAYGRFLRDFGSDETVVLALETLQPLSPEDMRRLEVLSKDLASFRGVEQVRSVLSFKVLKTGLFGIPKDEPIAAEYLRSRESLEEFLKKVAGGPPEAARFLSADGRLFSIVITVSMEDASRRSRHSLIEAFRSRLAREVPEGGVWRMTGTAVEQDAFLQRIESDRKLFVPATLAAITLLLWLFRTSVRSIFFAWAVMGASLACVQGAMALTGTQLHALTSLLAPVLLIVAVSSSVLAAKSFARPRPLTAPERRSAEAYAEIFLPSFLAALTTVVGFASLWAAPIRALHEFGLFGALGALAAWTLTMLWAPFFFAGTSGGSKRPESLAVLARPVSFIARKMAVPVVIFSAVFIVAATFQAKTIQASTDILKIFHPNDPFRRDTEAFEKKLGGIYPMEVVIVPAPDTDMRSPGAWKAVRDLERRLASMPHVTESFSIANAVGYVERVLGDEAEGRLLPRILDSLPDKMGADLSRLAAPGYRRLRMTLLLDSSDSRMMNATARKISEIARESLPPGWSAEPTGQTLLLARMSEKLVEGEVRSVLLAFGIVLVMIALFFRSLRDALFCVLPNLFPVSGLFGAMAVFKVPLNTATAAIASVAVGLIFNNTIYFVHRYRAFKAGSSREQALESTLADAIHPMLASSMILAGGFAVTIAGRMVPTAQFGMLSVLTVTLAAFGDAVLLPSLIRLWPR